ncbi:MAG: hypothetical protein CVV11_05590 [Gammaproteobacteria bacterium HGW-Gammaproteobacteria-15]|nr:MAG: hypothetical protein CVV11_05590 [Gammaproteobacteria bacterium HGW-Gammaproteobacteria-15]
MPMHQLTQVELDFQCHSTTMAQWFNAAGEQLFIDELLPLAQQVLDEFDTGMAVRLDEIQLQLPPLHLPADRYVLQHSFREALRQQLWLLLPAAVPQPDVTKRPGLTAAQQQQLIMALQQADSKALQQHWPLYLQHAAQLLSILRYLASHSNVCQALAFGLTDAMLAQLLQLLAPSEQRFMLQLMAQPQLFSVVPGSSNADFRYQPAPLPPPALQQRQRHLWQFSLSYLLVERGSQFNRRSYLHYLLRKMAAHDNLSLQSLVQHMLLTLQHSRQLFARHSPLLLQLTELLTGMADAPLQPPGVTKIASATEAPQVGLTVSQHQQLLLALRLADNITLQRNWALYLQHSAELLTILRQLASRSDLCQVLAFGLSHAMLAQLLQLLAPSEQRFMLQLMAQPQLFSVVQSSVKTQPQSQSAPLPPAALQQRQRHLWQLSLSYLLVERGSQFNRRSYLHYLLRKMAAHDNLSVQSLVQHMQRVLQRSRQLFSWHSPLLLQLTELLAGIAEPASLATDGLADSFSALPGYFSYRLAQPVTALPQVGTTRPVQRSALQHQARRWRQWQQLLLLGQLTLAQQRQFNLLLRQLLQQPNALWLDGLRQQLSGGTLLARLVQYASDDHLQQLFQQLQPASFASIQPYTSLLQWGLGGISLPLPLYRQARWQPLLQCSLQRQPLTLPLLISQLQQWLEAETGSAASRTLLQQLAQQLQHYTGNAAQGSRPQLLQQLKVQLAGMAATATSAAQPATAPKAAASGPEVLPASSPLVSGVAQAHTSGGFIDGQTPAQAHWVTNAGIVLAAPYIPMLLQRLGWVSAQRFTSIEQAWQACALLHYMTTGHWQPELRPDYWQQWPLPMLLSGVQPPCPVGFVPQLSSEALAMADSLLAGILAQWPKLASSSVTTLRECFLQRGGTLERAGNGSGWQLQLDSGPYDMLLDGLPWSYSLIRYPWMQGEVYVHWRG